MGKIAGKSVEITDEMWLSCNKFNINMINEYLDSATHLSPKSRDQYESALRIYAYWIKMNCEDKSVTDIKSREYLKYQNWLTNNGLCASAIKVKRSAVSNLNNYIMIYYEDEFPTFRNYINKSIKVPTTGFVHKKEPLNPDEYRLLCDELEKREEWQKLAYLKFTYITGCRREESRLLLKDVVNHEPIYKKVKIKDSEGNEAEVEIKKYKTSDIRCKGKGKVGKIRKLEFNEEAMEALKKWLEIRGEDDCPYMFAVKYSGKMGQASPTTFNHWCGETFAEIVKRRVHPHILRESRATNLVVHSGQTLETCRKLLGHLSTETTKIYVIRDDSDDADEAFVD
jgi:site-specific recombinase XerD